MNFLWSGSNPQRTTRSSIILSCPGSQICHWTDSFSNCTDSPQRALAELGTVMCRRPSGENDQAIAAGLLGYRLMCLGQYHRAGVHRMQQCWSALLIFNTTQSDKTSTQNLSPTLTLSLTHSENHWLSPFSCLPPVASVLYCPALKRDPVSFCRLLLSCLVAEDEEMFLLAQYPYTQEEKLWRASGLLYHFRTMSCHWRRAQGAGINSRIWSTEAALSMNVWLWGS